MQNFENREKNAELIINIFEDNKGQVEYFLELGLQKTIEASYEHKKRQFFLVLLFLFVLGVEGPVN